VSHSLLRRLEGMPKNTHICVALTEILKGNTPRLLEAGYQPKIG